MVALGGMAGSVLRYGAYLLFRGPQFPYATLLVNTVGSLLIGLILGYYNKAGEADQSMHLLLATGLCGGFTTFSAFSNENYQLLNNGHYTTALLYIAATLVLGLGATATGFLIMKN